MRKLDSMWWHESPANGKLASSHIAILFCALARGGMIIQHLLELEFDGIPSAFDDESLSPMEYCLAYTDGEIYDDYIRPKYRKAIAELCDSDEITRKLFSLDDFEHSTSNKTYTLVCSWHNVEVLKSWLRQRF